jgi:hypothetical protein
MRPKSRIDYLIKEIQCEEAIDALNRYEDLSEWLKNYEKLFMDLTNTPPRLPTLIKAYFNGEKFPAIRLFCEF